LFQRPKTQDKIVEVVRETLKDATHLVLEVRRENVEKEREGREMVRKPIEV
jgi:hypothetical protein